ncbi:hypothetical protein ACIRO3_35355 [Streptomyces sp. NPDC102278]|uniref:hypothetical protein n=1 Tax=Streptomyces sp. NPDC102278 TaxID=3366152 RepID=UPI00382581FE
MTAPLRSGLLTRTVLPTGDLRIRQLPNRDGHYVRKQSPPPASGGPENLHEASRGHPALWIRWHGALRTELPAPDPPA